MKIRTAVLFAVVVAVTCAKDIDPKIYLSQFGYYNPFSFDAGNNYKQAVKDFQTFHKLKVTGIVDDVTKVEMTKPRCGLPDKQPRHFGYFQTWWNKWGHKDVTYAFSNLGRDLSADKTREWMKKAFDMWAAVTPLRFREVSGRGNINIGWYSRGRSHTHDPFDGPGGTLAHAFYPRDGHLHFDEDENWIINCQGRGTDLLWVAVHEIGHALGLKHSNVQGTIMWPTYYRCNNALKLHSDDIAGIQKLYGKGGTGPNPPTGPPVTIPPGCNNRDKDCDDFANRGYCTDNKEKKWMADNCCVSCKGAPCKNRHNKCVYWANIGECNKNPNYMLRVCQTACKQCQI